MLATEALDQLFHRWEATYDPAPRSAFFRDGIIHEPTFVRQRLRVLFVLLEPNSDSPRYPRSSGCRDLRVAFGTLALNKAIDRNLALWSRLVLDGKTGLERLRKEETKQELQRVAVMNLKKIGGTGKANYPQIEAHANRDRDRLREELGIIAPTVIVACGAETNRILATVLEIDQRAGSADRPWSLNGVPVLPVMHPSQRDGGRAAFERMWAMAHAADLIDTAPGTAGPADSKSDPRSQPSGADGSAWVLRPYPHGIDRLGKFLADHIVAVGWSGLGDIGSDSRADLREKVNRVYSHHGELRRAHDLATLIAFRDRMQIGDPVILAPRTGDSGSVWLGRIASEYRYEPSCDGDVGYPHQRVVSWSRSIARVDLPSGLQRTLKGRSTLFRADRDEVEELLQEG